MMRGSSSRGRDAVRGPPKRRPHGAQPRPLDFVAASRRCTTSPLQLLLASERGWASSWVRVRAPWY